MHKNAEYYYDLAADCIIKNNGAGFSTAARGLIRIDDSEYNLTSIMWDVYESGKMCDRFESLFEWACENCKNIVEKYIDFYVEISTLFDLHQVFICLINYGLEFEVLSCIVRYHSYNICGNSQHIYIQFNLFEFELERVKYSWFILNARPENIKDFFRLYGPYISPKVIKALDQYREILCTFDSYAFLFKIVNDAISGNFRPLWIFFDKIKNPLIYAKHAGAQFHQFQIEYQIRPLMYVLILIKRKIIPMPKCIIKIIHKQIINFFTHSRERWESESVPFLPLCSARGFASHSRERWKSESVPFLIKNFYAVPVGLLLTPANDGIPLLYHFYYYAVPISHSRERWNSFVVLFLLLCSARGFASHSRAASENKIEFLLIEMIVDTFKLFDIVKPGENSTVEIFGKFTNVEKKAMVRKNLPVYFEKKFARDYQFHCAKDGENKQPYYEMRNVGTFVEFLFTFSSHLFVKIFIKSNEQCTRGLASTLNKIFCRYDETPEEVFTESEKDIEEKVMGKCCSTLCKKRICELDINNCIVLTESVTFYILGQQIYANYKDGYYLCGMNENETRILIDNAKITPALFRDIIIKTDDITFKQYVGIN